MSSTFMETFNHITKTIITDVMVRPAAKIVSVASNTVPSDINIHALWDTGAGMSVISENIVKRLFPLVRVAEWGGNRQYDMLIGMDIISLGNFSIANNTGKTVFSFKV